jgi:hypothetical protein
MNLCPITINGALFVALVGRVFVLLGVAIRNRRVR